VEGSEAWIVFQHLGEVEQKLGDEKDAADNFSKAKTLKPKSDDIKD
jgi:hypothetical protein